ncbi:hypothetical protein B7C51_25295 (plasmid) [Paenibacillus larvae subsp. pulvifaciens]|uniref:Uncharacterized protein n=1 Tax=Paenibacillus larvae subsp. pulvifaciens TaxID=1477 RepID=A0A1V0V0F3_9BACL|nr:hypothetical protein [Paenibacillus larvae]ARF70788.1 hypothetical protein B7C51_25295 [Paenibacillus larvae subsp. pulvifaciens]
MKKYRKKPVVVSAKQWWKMGDVPDAKIQPCNPHSRNICTECGDEITRYGKCPTLEGHHIVCPGDYIIRGVKGEYYPCKPDIFAETYEPVE